MTFLFAMISYLYFAAQETRQAPGQLGQNTSGKEDQKILAELARARVEISRLQEDKTTLESKLRSVRAHFAKVPAQQQTMRQTQTAEIPDKQDNTASDKIITIISERKTEQIADCSAKVADTFYDRHPKLDGRSIPEHIRHLIAEWKSIRASLGSCANKNDCIQKTDRIFFRRFPELRDQNINAYGKSLRADWDAIERAAKDCTG